MASSEKEGTQLRVSVEAPATKFLCGTAICQRDYNVLNLKPGLISAYDTYSDQDPEVFTFELNLDSPSTFNESTTSDSDNGNPTTPTFNRSTTSDADNESPTIPTIDHETFTSTESLSTSFTHYDVLKVFSNLINQLSSSVSTTEDFNFHTRFKRTFDYSNDIATLLAASDSNSNFSTAL